MVFDEKFWLAIAFISFVALLLRYVAPMIKGQLDSKSKQIAEELLAAKEAKEQAQKFLQEAQNRYEESLGFAQKLIKDSNIEAQKFLSDAQISAQEEIAKKLAAVEVRIKNEEQQAIRDIKIAVINSAIKKVEENMHNMPKNNSETLIKKALNDVNKLVH